MSAVTKQRMSEAAANDTVAVPTGYWRTEVGVIPEDWGVKSIAELGQIKTGPFGTVLKAEEYSGTEGVPMISVGEIGAGSFAVSEATPRVPPEVVRRLPQYLLRTGDIVFGRKGAVDRSALVTDDEDGWFLGSDGIRIRPLSPSFAPYLAWQFRRHEVQSWLLHNAVGTTMASLNQGVLSHVRVPYAPPRERRAIADALSDVDGLLGALAALIAKMRAIKHSAMQQLLTGKTRLPGFSGPWEIVATDDVAARTTGFWGSSKWSVETPNKVGVIRAGDISPLGVLTDSAVRYFSDVEIAKAACQLHDVVITVSGNGLGKTWLADNQPHLAASNFVRILRQKHGCVHGPFLAAALKGGVAQQLLAEHTATSAYPNLRPTFFSTRWLSLPPIDEQTAIATVLSDMDAEIAALERRRDKTRAIELGMMQQLLTGRVRLVEPSAREASC